MLEGHGRYCAATIHDSEVHKTQGNTIEWQVLNNFDLNLVEKKFPSKGTMSEFTIKHRPWDKTGENVGFLSSLFPAAQSVTPSIGVYIAW